MNLKHFYRKAKCRSNFWTLLDSQWQVECVEDHSRCAVSWRQFDIGSLRTDCTYPYRNWNDCARRCRKKAPMNCTAFTFNAEYNICHMGHLMANDTNLIRVTNRTSSTKTTSEENVDFTDVFVFHNKTNLWTTVDCGSLNPRMDFSPLVHT